MQLCALWDGCQSESVYKIPFLQARIGLLPEARDMLYALASCKDV